MRYHIFSYHQENICVFAVEPNRSTDWSTYFARSLQIGLKNRAIIQPDDFCWDETSYTPCSKLENKALPFHAEESESHCQCLTNGAPSIIGPFLWDELMHPKRLRGKPLHLQVVLTSDRPQSYHVIPMLYTIGSYWLVSDVSIPFYAPYWPTFGQQILGWRRHASRLWRPWKSWRRWKSWKRWKRASLPRAPWIPKRCVSVFAIAVG